jgi:hypothetical protein
MEESIIAHVVHDDLTGTAALSFLSAPDFLEKYAKLKGIDTTNYNIVGLNLYFGQNIGSFSLRFLCQVRNSNDTHSLVSIEAKETLQDFLDRTKGFDIKLFNPIKTDGFLITEHIDSNDDE